MRDSEESDSIAAPHLKNLSTDVALSAINRAPLSMVLSNPNIEDCPVVYVNRAFERVTGYSAEAAIGRNCRFLQGDDTDPGAIEMIRNALRSCEDVTVDIKNYRADGEPFWNRLMITPLTTQDGAVAYFLGVQLAMDRPPDRSPGTADDIETALSEVQHRVKNHLSMIVGMIRMQARGTPEAADDFSTLSRRVEALQLLYEELMEGGRGQSSNRDAVSLGAYLTRVSNAISYLDGRSGVRVNTDADEVSVPFSSATQIGLILSEIMTNTMQHAFEGRDAGLVEVRIKQLSGGVLRIQVSDDGIGMPEDIDWPGDGNLGGRIVAQLVAGLNAQISVVRAVSGTIITCDIPYSSTATE